MRDGKFASLRDCKILRSRVSETEVSLGAETLVKVVIFLTMTEPMTSSTPLIEAVSIGEERMISPLKVVHSEILSKSAWEAAVKSFEQISGRDVVLSAAD